MGKRVLVTGGAGFIGSHLADELLNRGYQVRALDNLCQQVHGTSGLRPEYLNKEVELITGDVRNPDCVKSALAGVDAVFHFAAKVGVGQSMYQVADYVTVNETGTAVLLQELLDHPVEKLIVASSMSVYGEGVYRREGGKLISGTERPRAQLESHRWELQDEKGQPLQPVPTTENKTPCLASVYAMSKYAQERHCLVVGQAYGIPTVALRFFNVYGPRQALSNPYTGVLAIFASRLMNNRPPMIFEDGNQQRDFVHVRDVARACCLALEKPEAAGKTINIGSGEPHTVLEVARKMAGFLNKDQIEPETTGKYRVGDIRHCFADTTLARRVLNYKASTAFNQGVRELAAWLEGENATDRVEEAGRELLSRGLAI